jgi:hypothetical protein
MQKLSFDRVENILNECGIPEDETERVSEEFKNSYGTWLRKNDPEKFQDEYLYMENVLLKVNQIRKAVENNKSEE